MNSSNQVQHANSFSRHLEVIWKWNSTNMVKALLIFLFFSLLLFSMFRILTERSERDLLSTLLDHQLPKEESKNILNQDQAPEDSISGQSIAEKTHDELLGGLLLAGLDESSCQSRYRSNLYRRTQPRRPSSYLVSRLRNYEVLQKQCGPNTDPYNKTIESIKEGNETTYYSACKYVIYSPIKGLGNRMLTVAAAFLYALLTNRVLFIGDGGNFPDLFCEPFPEVSWFLPSDFPVDQFRPFDRFSAPTYRNMQKNGSTGNSSVPLIVYFYLGYGNADNDKIFFCDEDQALLQNVPWLIMQSDLYFLPSLFLVPSFQKELDNLFPEKETVFHHLGRYLFHPSNSVWGLITRYYEAYLAKADEILGIQIRVYHGGDRKTPSLDQILACTKKENLLPDVNMTEPLIKESRKPKTKAVLVASLSATHSEELRKMYWQYATITGEMIAVHQPSHDEYQRSQDQMHDRKALADVYLLSFTDKLVTSGLSTFGYVAQSLGGLRPYILYMAYDEQVPNPPCQQALSMEPCYHFAPPFYSCGNTTRIETANLSPHVQRCEDIFESLKLLD